MMSFGARLSEFRRQAIAFITEKAEAGEYRNEPGDIWVNSGGIGYLKDSHLGNIKLYDLSTERLCNICDKIFFRPLGTLIKKESNGRATLEPVNNETTQTTDMAFEIKKDIPLPGQLLTEPIKVGKKTSSNHTNYRTLPLKDMKVGDCVIVHECTPETISSKYSSTRIGVEKFVSLMDTRKKFMVAKTHDLKVGVWRVE